jgi:Tol biopolymer transport system component
MTDIPGDYSPSGQFLFKRGAGDEGPGPLLLLDPDGAEPSQLGDRNYEDAGRFSPDGTLVLTAVDGSIVILDLQGQVVNRISDDGFLFGAAWSPGGTHITFSRTTSGFIADIWTSLPDGTDRQQVTRTPANEINVDWGVGGD